MPIFMLTPTDQTEITWRGSRHKGSCRVHAPDESRAREWVNAEFYIFPERAEAPEHTVVSPWLIPGASHCNQVHLGPLEEYHEGQIEVQTSGGAWKVIKEGASSQSSESTLRGLEIEARAQVGGRGKNPVDDQLSDDSAASGATAEDTIIADAATVTAGKEYTLDAESGAFTVEGNDAALNVAVPLTQQTITRIIQNRQIIGGQAKLLLRLLSDIGDLDAASEGRRNFYLRDALGLSFEVSEHELLSLLRGLRDELRRFNDALENASVDPTALERLRDIGLKNLEALAANKVFVSMQGASLGAMMWTLMIDARLINAPAAMDILKLILTKV